MCATTGQRDPMVAVSVSTVKVDSKGRILLPPSLRDELDLEPGDVVSLKRTKAGVALARSGKTDYMSRFRKMPETPPKRLGEPLNPGPKQAQNHAQTGDPSWKNSRLCGLLETQNPSLREWKNLVNREKTKNSFQRPGGPSFPARQPERKVPCTRTEQSRGFNLDYDKCFLGAASRP